MSCSSPQSVSGSASVGGSRAEEQLARLHFWIIIFCARKIFSVGISMPRSPRATMTASPVSRMSSKLTRPSWFSTLLMILMPRPCGPRTCRGWVSSGAG